MYGMNNFIGRELRKGEEVLWSGHPDRAAFLSKGDIILVPASLLWSAMALSFAIPMLSAVRTDNDVLPFVLFFAIPFAVMAVYCMFGRFAFRLWVKSRTHYLVTNERVVALSKVFGNNVHASFIDEIGLVNSVRSMRGAGSIWFGDAPWWMINLGSSALDSPVPLPGGPGPVVFYDIRGANEVRELITELRSRR